MPTVSHSSLTEFLRNLRTAAHRTHQLSMETDGLISAIEDARQQARLRLVIESLPDPSTAKATERAIQGVRPRLKQVRTRLAKISHDLQVLAFTLGSLRPQE